ncbi:MAG: hypothetical protein ACTSPU_09620 [Promethearchaeota archaeon]
MVKQVKPVEYDEKEISMKSLLRCNDCGHSESLDSSLWINQCPSCKSTKIEFTPYITRDKKPIKYKKSGSSDDYISSKNFKCRDCRRRFRSKSRINQCPSCFSNNIKRIYYQLFDASL